MAQQPASDVDSTAADHSEGRTIRWLQLVTASLMGLLIGGLLAWMFLNIGGSSILFVVGFVGGTYYLYQKSLASAALGTGLYISAALVVLTPMFYYVPLLLQAEEGTAEGAGQTVGSVLGLVIWGFVFFVLGLVIFVMGYFANRRARRKLNSRDEDQGYQPDNLASTPTDVRIGCRR